jgi:hypothetical protein
VADCGIDQIDCKIEEKKSDYMFLLLHCSVCICSKLVGKHIGDKLFSGVQFESNFGVNIIKAERSRAAGFVVVVVALPSPPPIILPRCDVEEAIKVHIYLEKITFFKIVIIKNIPA